MYCQSEFEKEHRVKNRGRKGKFKIRKSTEREKWLGFRNGKANTMFFV